MVEREVFFVFMFLLFRGMMGRMKFNDLGKELNVFWGWWLRIGWKLVFGGGFRSLG